MGGPERRGRPDPGSPGDGAHGSTGPPGTAGGGAEHGAEQQMITQRTRRAVARLLPWGAWLGILGAVAPARASAQPSGAPAGGYARQTSLPASAVPAQLRDVGFDQKLDDAVPLDIPFEDEQGRRV